MAFTVGSLASYADLPIGAKKIGRHGPTEEEPDGYGGGIVFRSKGSAISWIESTGNSRYGVYRIGLPVPWEECVDEGGPHSAILVDCFLLGPA